MPKVSRGPTVTVRLSPKEVRDAIEHKAWCAAVDDDPSIAVTGKPELLPDVNGGYQVRYTRVAR